MVKPILKKSISVSLPHNGLPAKGRTEMSPSFLATNFETTGTIEYPRVFYSETATTHKNINLKVKVIDEEKNTS